MNDKTLSVCNQKKQLPFLILFYIKEKAGLSTQNTFHSVWLVFFFLPVSCGHHFHHLTMFSFYPAGRQTGSSETWASLPHPHVFPAPFFFVSLFFVLPVSEVLFVVWSWLRLRWEARPGQVRRLQRCNKAHGVTDAFETSILCFQWPFFTSA